MLFFFFFLVRFYEGVVELSLTAAEKKDPQGLGLHFYKNGEPEEDVVGLQAFQERQVFRIPYYYYTGCFVLSDWKSNSFGEGMQVNDKQAFYKKQHNIAGFAQHALLDYHYYGTDFIWNRG